MPTQPKTVKVLPDSELGLTLKAAQASGEPLIVDTGENSYTILVALTEPAPDIFANYDPEAAIAGLRAARDALAGVDVDQLLRDLRDQREQDSSGRPAQGSSSLNSEPYRQEVTFDGERTADHHA